MVRQLVVLALAGALACPAEQVRGLVSTSLRAQQDAPSGGVALALGAAGAGGVCLKQVSARGAGHFGNCSSGEEKQAGICYKRCEEGASGEGPLCWAACPGAAPFSLGPLCCESKEACAKVLLGEGAKLAVDVADAIVDRDDPAALSADLKKLIEDAKDLVVEQCGAPAPAPAQPSEPGNYAVCVAAHHVRGLGHLAKECGAEEEKQGGICYKRCAAGETGHGPLCLSSCKSPDVTMGVFCCATQADCAKFAIDAGVKLGVDVAKISIDAQNPAALIKDLEKLVQDAKGLSVAECSAAGAEAEANAKVFSWVPSPQCKSPVKLCYEGTDKAALVNVSKIDFVNPCRGAATIEDGSCAKHGYPRLVGADPIFKKINLYLPAKAEGEELGKNLALLDGALAGGICLKHAHARGVGHLGNCTEEEEKQAGICYKRCEAGQDGVGPVCWQQCAAPEPISFGPICCATTEECVKKLVGEGARLAWDAAKLAKDSGLPNPIAIFKDIAKLIEDAKGLAIDECAAAAPIAPDAPELNGDVCVAAHHVRGIGRIAKNCTADEEQQAGICYPKCAATTDKGVGPVCWSACAPAEVPMGPFCCATKEACTKFAIAAGAKLGIDVAKAVKDAQDPAALLKDLAKLFADVKALGVDQCSATPF
jgi:hypothetical protein